MVSFLADTKPVKSFCQSTKGLANVAALNLAKDREEECFRKVQKIQKNLRPVEQELARLSLQGNNNSSRSRRVAKLEQQRQELAAKLRNCQANLSQASKDVTKAQQALVVARTPKKAAPSEKSLMSRLNMTPTCGSSNNLMSGNAVAGLGGVAISHPGDSHYSLVSRVTMIQQKAPSLDDSIRTVNSSFEEEEELRVLRKRRLEAEARSAELQARLDELEYSRRLSEVSQTTTTPVPASQWVVMPPPTAPVG